jgi:hypothetical protein
MVIWSQSAGFLLLGYLCMTRSFAYLGIPPLFIGEIVLAAFLLFKPRVALGTWATSLLRASPLNALGLALLIFVAYGVWQVGRGVLGGTSILYTLKFFIFNYYTFYLFLGIWIGLQDPAFLPKLIRVVAWVHGIYGVIWLAVLRTAMVQTSGSEVEVFGLPAAGAVVILGLLCFERDLRAVWLVLVLNIAVTLALQARATWLGLAVGMLVWGLLTGRLSRVIAIGVAGLAVIGIVELSSIQLGVGGRTTSINEMLSRVIAPIDIELAKELSPNAEHHANTMEWRELWWAQIWLSVHSTPTLEAFGHGYGFDLWGLAPLEIREFDDRDIRTPHNVFFYALGYTGWVGVALFSALQLTILRLLWQTFRCGGQPAGVVWWFMAMSMALFEASFDTPYKAIPFYLLMGLSIAPGLQLKQKGNMLPSRSPVLSAAVR